MLAAWTVSGSGNGVPCGGCGNPQGVHVLRIDTNLRPIGDAAELSGYGAQLSGLFRNDGAWYLISQDWLSRHNEVSRIDDDSSVSIVDGGSGEIYGVPFGEAGFATFRQPDFRLFGSDPGGGGFGWPHRLADPREMTFVHAGSHMLALFAARADRLPYNGAHRAFVTSLELPVAPRRRRPVRH